MYRKLAELLKNNKPAALATLVAGEQTGAKMLITNEGVVDGSIHAQLDARIADDAIVLLANEQSSLKHYSLANAAFDVFIETFPPPQHLIIMGGVHVAIPLHRIAKLLGYHVTVVDARGMLATPERFPEADSVMVEWPDEALATLHLDSGTSVVVLTHDPKFDYPALLAAIQSPARYVGAIGSKNTNSKRMEALREMGATTEQLARIFAPVGLDLGGKSPSEIALAVMAEIVAQRYSRGGGHLKKP
ncbi:MAG TPA: XdhC/CoxI family protein [Chloroflexia bacterium]|nr:XdhC/CoxI family protein [Chloroflexia bacterium]